MTTPTKQAEADQASVAFQVALTQIGAGTVEEALKLWQAVPATARAATSTAWLRKAITLVMSRRRMSRDLARAYYRLARALRTGTTVADPYHPEPTYVTLDTLRREFAALVGDAEDGSLEERSDSASPAPNPSSPAASGAPVEAGEEGQDDSAQEVEDDPNDDQILVEELPGLREDEERIEREAEDEARTILDLLGPANLERKTSAIDESKPATDVDKARDQAHQEAGARQAAAAARIVNNGGRSAVWNHMSKDRRVLGYIRLSRTGTPCGWCAMLISRGAVYRSQKKAGPSLADLESGNYADGDKFHDNCNCYAEPIFSRGQYGSSDLYELNRRYEALWPKVTRGLSGKAAVSAWRRFIRQEQKAAAQEARQTSPSVQEA
ncbi:VG15 protein [Streptomyces sp. NPDC054849]